MRRIAWFLWGLFLWSCPILVYADSFDPEERLNNFTTIIDQAGAIILQTGLPVHSGDKFISESNEFYEIISVDGEFAKAAYIRMEIKTSREPLALPVQAAAGQNSPLIAIYHTHTDESYIPTNGTSSEPGRGSIMAVGEAFGKRLAELGFRTQVDKTLHDPHDANAYQRSRRTFMQLAANAPAALFDVHRDSAPLSAYQTQINGQSATKLLLVVGRQNQNFNTSLSFAQNLKNAADAKYRGLIRGIFIARGNYNQDLNPKAMLIEIGTQYNSLETAQRSVALFADVLPSLFAPQPPEAAGSPGLPAEQPPVNVTPSPPVSNTSSTQNDILILLGILVAGAAFYLFLSTGSWQEAKSKLQNFRAKEFRDLLRPLRKRK